MQLLLGSKSPRRRELLSGFNIPFDVVDIDADESFPASLMAEDIPIYISRAKADAHKERLTTTQVLITADTIVWVDGQQLGKPKDLEDAKRMISLLSGKTHQVYTGVTLTVHPDSAPARAGLPVQQSFASTTDVTFRAITEEEIDYYVHTFRPLDKAGAYGIQEWIGYVACTGLHGSYFNVVGLPVAALYPKLQPYLQY